MYVPFNQFVISLIRSSFAPRTTRRNLQARSSARVRRGGSSRGGDKIRTMPQVLADSLAQRRFTVLLLSLFAGLCWRWPQWESYGVMSYAVSQDARDRRPFGSGRASE